MSRDAHVSLERLTAWALEPTPLDDRATQTHLASCRPCLHALSRVKAELDDLRDAAWREADDHFDESTLRQQRHRILDRIAHVGQPARVITFPGRARSATTGRSGGSRRWISLAAAAGLIIGIVAGQSWRVLPLEPAGRILVEPTRSARAGDPFVRTAVSALTEDELLNEIDLSLQQGRRATELRALDALTPTMNEIR